MPDCSRIGDFQLLDSRGHWGLVIHAPLHSSRVNFAPILKHTFQGVKLVEAAVRTDNEPNRWKSRFSIPKSAAHQAEILEFLKLLKHSVTISDDADESHALRLHKVPYPTDDADNPDWKHTSIGNLTHEAKSYSQYTGNRTKATCLAEKMKAWVARHPRYRTAKAIVAAPPGNRSKRYDLPKLIVGHLSEAFGYRVVSCKSDPLMSPQKSVEKNPKEKRENVFGKFQLQGNLRNQCVIVLDDLYESGETVNELVRACREAGARCILSLTATKNATGTRGVPPRKWYEIYKEEGGLDDE